MTTDQEYFENNIMPKLLAACEDAKSKGETQYCFDENKVPEFRPQGGLWTRAWEGPDLRKNLGHLVNKGLIKKVGDEKYCLIEAGKQWKEKGAS